jgi:hypothetical protein
MKMKCDQVMEKLMSYHDGELTGALERDIREHLAGCGDCAATLKMLGEADRAAGIDTPGEEYFDGLTARVMDAVRHEKAEAEEKGADYWWHRLTRMPMMRLAPALSLALVTVVAIGVWYQGGKMNVRKLEAPREMVAKAPSPPLDLSKEAAEASDMEVSHLGEGEGNLELRGFSELDQVKPVTKEKSGSYRKEDEPGTPAIPDEKKVVLEPETEPDRSDKDTAAPPGEIYEQFDDDSESVVTEAGRDTYYADADADADTDGGEETVAGSLGSSADGSRRQEKADELDMQAAGKTEVPEMAAAGVLKESDDRLPPVEAEKTAAMPEPATGPAPVVAASPVPQPESVARPRAKKIAQASSEPLAAEAQESTVVEVMEAPAPVLEEALEPEPPTDLSSVGRVEMDSELEPSSAAAREKALLPPEVQEVLDRYFGRGAYIVIHNQDLNGDGINEIVAVQPLQSGLERSFTYDRATQAPLPQAQQFTRGLVVQKVNGSIQQQLVIDESRIEDMLQNSLPADGANVVYTLRQDTQGDPRNLLLNTIPVSGTASSDQLILWDEAERAYRIDTQ